MVTKSLYKVVKFIQIYGTQTHPIPSCKHFLTVSKDAFISPKSLANRWTCKVFFQPHKMSVTTWKMKAKERKEHQFPSVRVNSDISRPDSSAQWLHQYHRCRTGRNCWSCSGFASSTHSAPPKHWKSVDLTTEATSDSPALKYILYSSFLINQLFKVSHSIRNSSHSKCILLTFTWSFSLDSPNFCQCILVLQPNLPIILPTISEVGFIKQLLHLIDPFSIQRLDIWSDLPICSRIETSGSKIGEGNI